MKMRMRRRVLHGLVSAGALAAAVAAAVACVAAGSGGTQTSSLGVAGRANATPWIAADGDLVAVVWGAASGEKQSDVFLAVSRDGGTTFGAPVRVNAAPGEARLGGELPPRVVLTKPASGGRGGSSSASSGGGAGDPEIAVLWTARVAVPAPPAASGGSADAAAGTPAATRTAAPAAAATASPGTAANAAAPAVPATVTTIEIARSRDGGRTFSAPVSLQTTGAPGDRGWPSLAADGRGRLHAIWLDHRGLAAMAGHHQHGGGAGAAHQPGAATSAAAVTDGVAMAQRSGLYYASLGAGTSKPSPDRELTPGVCYCCKTALGVGRDGALFAAWRQVYPGNLRDIAFAVSRDDGRTFSAPVRVSEDHWEINGCPDDGPAMAIGADGTIHLVWPTVLTGADGEPRGALFYASSRDGRTFTPRVRIPALGSPKPMHPQVVLDGRTNRLAVAWDEVTQDGQRVAVVRAIQPAAGGGAATFGPVLTLGGARAQAQTPTPAPAQGQAPPAQYPILASTSRGLLAVWTRGPSTSSTIAVERVDLQAPSASAPTAADSPSAR